MSWIPGYSGFVRVGPVSANEEIWTGFIQPYAHCDLPETALIIDDLYAGAPVCVQHGSLSHDPSCRRPHTSMSLLTTMHVLNCMDTAQNELFAIRVVVPPAPRHPKAIALYPEISADSYPDHPHLFRQDRRPGRPQSTEPDALCTYRPGSGEWSRATSSMTTYIDFVALFLAKHVVWRRTRAIAGRGLWLGPDASHHPSALVRTIKRTDECWCGSGKAYGDCHRQGDLEAASRMASRSAA